MKQYATVKKHLDENRAVIAVTRESSCGKSCSSCNGCSEKSRIVSAVANNLCGADVGQRVCVEMPTGHIIGIASAVYLLPIAFMIISCLVAVVLGVSDGICILAGLAGIVLAVPVTRLIDKRISKKCEAECNIISVLDGDS